jgi:hypothetical protein
VVSVASVGGKERSGKDTAAEGGVGVLARPSAFGLSEEQAYGLVFVFVVQSWGCSGDQRRRFGCERLGGWRRRGGVLGGRVC